MKTEAIVMARSVSALSNKIRRRMDALSGKTPYSGAQSRALHYILANQDIELYQKDIEAVFGLRPPSATSLLKKMEENGLIRRETSKEDARLKRIIPTEQAQECREQVLKDLENLERDLVNGISAEDLNVFYSVLQKMIENIGD